ncbi:hypothetical protein MMPV_005594 [Pyropia vietnamensis]
MLPTVRRLTKECGVGNDGEYEAISDCYGVGVDAKVLEDIRADLDESGYRVARTRQTALDEECKGVAGEGG